MKKNQQYKNHSSKTHQSYRLLFFHTNNILFFTKNISQRLIIQHQNRDKEEMW